MRKMPLKLRHELSEDPFYERCARENDGGCQGRITFEHAMIFAGRQINEKWAIIPLCECHHAVNQFQDGGDLNKEKNQWIALNRITSKEISERFPKAFVDWERRKRYLNGKYGDYSSRTVRV